jgi:hypothetical protein
MFFFATIFRVGLLPYLRVVIASMKKVTLIEHKEVVVIWEESGPISLIYNVLLTTPKANTMVKPIVHVIDKPTLTYTNCGKTSTIIIRRDRY